MNRYPVHSHKSYIIRVVSITALIILISFSLSAQGLTKKVLFVGNSYVIVNNLPQITVNIAGSMGDQLIFSSASIANYTLQLHSTNPTTLSLIRQGGWDYVVLQEYSQYPSEPLSWVQTNVYPYAQYLDGEINRYNTGVETMFYMTWGRKNGDAERCPRLPSVCTYVGMDDLTRERYMYMAQANQAVVSPVGAVWRYIRDNYPTIELYDADGSHPSPAGSYAAACTFYTAIFRKDPTLSTYNFTLSPDDASKIRNAAKQVVFNNMITWYIGFYDKFTISAGSGPGGTINPSGNSIFNYGASATFSIIPNTGYRILDVKVDNVSLGNPSQYTFTNISASHTIAASFSLITNIINAGAGSGGNISPLGNITVNYGSNQTFVISANTGYYLADVRVDNVSIGPVNSYTFNNVTSGHSISATFAPITFTISGSAGTGGIINPSGNVTVNYGSSSTFAVNPGYGYQISDVRVDNVSVGAVSSYTFSNIISNHTISASFGSAQYSVTATAGNGGSITPTGTSSVTHGTSRTYTIAPSTGFRISDVKVDNISVGQTASYTFNNITSNHSISATFAILTYTLTSQAGTGGSISPNGSLTMDYGSSRTYNIIPNTGYYVEDIIIDNVSAGPGSSYTISNITANHTIEVSFSLFAYNITAVASGGGSVSPSGITTVNYGSNASYTINPDIGFKIDDVKIDNVSAGAISTYSFNNVSSNHNLSASFTPITFTITSGLKSGGSISFPGKSTVNYGSDKIYSITPDVGFHIVDVLVDNKSVGPVASYTFSNITDNHDISASFAIITYKIATESNTGGSVNPSGESIINYGSDIGYTFTPDYGYRISDVKVDNLSKGSISSFSFKEVTSDHHLLVSFQPIPRYTLTSVKTIGGSISPSEEVTLFEGSDQLYEIIPSAGYRILDVLIDNLSVGSLSEYTFSNIIADHTIEALFTTRIDVNVYPNPFVDEFKLFIASPEGYSFDLYIADLNGKIIFRKNKIPGNLLIPVNLPATKGLYFLRLTLNSKKIATVRLIKS